MAYRGYVERGYEPVAQLFAKLIGAPDRGGGSFVVRYGDRTVVDIWGGVADSRTGRPWQRETLGLSFSTSKGVAATIVHRLADRGLLDYDEPVATYWREFAAGGKGRITVRQLLSHRAGLDALGPVAPDAKGLLDHLGAEQRLAARTPEYRAGAPAYHSITYGWLLAGLARAVTGQGMEQLVQSEICEPLGVDGLHYGLPATGDTARASACIGGLGGLVRLGGVALARLPGPAPGRRLLYSIFVPDMAVIFSGPEPSVLGTVMPAANGMFTAESLATMYAALGNLGVADGRRLLSAETARALSRIQTRAPDRNLMIPMVWRLGYHQAFVPRVWMPRAFGHFGYAGSGGWCDPATGLAVAFVSNQICPVTAPFGDLALMKLSRLAITASRAAGTQLQGQRALGGQHEHRAADAA